MTQAHHCDVLVIGAGPSGASAALTLLTHTPLSVILIEQSDLQKLRVGESVSASLFSIIDYLQIQRRDFGDDCFKPTQGNSAFWGSDISANRHAIFAPDRATYQVNREVFDMTLLEHVVERGGTLFPRTKSKGVHALGRRGYRVDVSHPQHGKFSITCRYLIDASGRNSLIGQSLGASVRQYDRLTGVGAFFNTRHASLEQRQLIESDEFGWWYSAALSENTLVVTYFSDFELIAKQRLNRIAGWQQHLARSHHMSAWVDGASSIDDTLWIRPAGTHFSQFTQVDNYIPVGDAACAFDPISSMGLGFAMASGCQAASVIGNSATPQKLKENCRVYQDDLARQFEQYMKLKQQFYTKEQRWRHAEFWRKRQQTLTQVA
ncbi:hypothetical protein GCM10007938_28620 [Vibrio zhanjiangensis]|uniref:FAD-binding domain-containing protein n=1 Tax=Vibrio zhanjiangensis TaxID=1046128 RepID=A0ABQ6F2J4_9VIBR|nr:lysine-epsilon-oxidase maturase LodB [Vibrio zhanjiangensis]GLT19080.1 hypothetical protein GCM10007938_28620 [Vibrio zhanjiangensis]